MVLTSCLCAFAIVRGLWQERKKAVARSHGKLLGLLWDCCGMNEQEKRPADASVWFGSCQLDVRNVQLWRDHQEVKLTSKAFAVLCYFVQHPGQLVTKDDLFAAAWPETVVSDATLTSCIQEVRQALGDDAKRPRYIETVHRRGFRFIAPVAAAAAPVSSSEFRVPSQEEGGNSQDSVGNQQELSANGQGVATNVEEPEAEPLQLPPTAAPRQPLPVPRSYRLRWWQVLVLVVVLVLGGVLTAHWRLVRLVVASYTASPVVSPESLPLPDKPSIVVLPFVNLSGDASQEYFSDGLTDDLINTLAQFPDLFIIARQSAFTYKGKTIKEQDISRELGVRYVLEGSVRRAGELVRMNVQLVDATTGGQLWAERYDRPFTEIFALQDDLIQKLTATLKLQLPLLKQGFPIGKTTGNVEAYDYVLRGWAHWLRASNEDNLHARELFEKALRLDPQYAEAHNGIGVTYYMDWLMKWGPAPQQALEQALAYGQKAVALDDAFPEGHMLLALVYAHKAQIDRALGEIERAIILQPSLADSYEARAEVLMAAGRQQESLQSIQHGIRLNPRGHVINFAMLGLAYHNTDQYAESITAYKRALAQTPFYPLAYPMLAFSYTGLWIGQQSHDPKILDQAHDAAQNGIALNDALPVAHTALGSVYLLQKQYDDAITEYERAVALDGNFVCGQMVCAFGLSLVGRVEEAVQVGERALSLKTLPVDDRCLYGIASAYAQAGRLEEAAALSQRLLQQFPNFLTSYLQLTDIYSQLGRETEARAAAAEVLRINPQFSLEVHKQRMPFKDPATLERHIAALRKAGLK